MMKRLNCYLKKHVILNIAALVTFFMPTVFYAQCGPDKDVFLYEFDVIERQYHKIPQGFDFTIQKQTDLLDIRERKSKIHRKIKIDRNYQMTDVLQFLDSKDVYEPKEDRLLESVYTYHGKKLKSTDGIRNTRESRYSNDSTFKNSFHVRQINYLKGNFGWTPVDDLYFRFLRAQGYTISYPEAGVIHTEKDDVVMQYDTVHFISFLKYTEEGIKKTHLQIFYEKCRGVIIPLKEVVTETVVLFSGDCIEKVIERVYPEKTTQVCLCETGYLSPRNSEGNITDFYIYPNPVENQLNLLNPYKGSDVFIQIYDINGKKLFEIDFPKSEDNLLIDTHKLTQGMYILGINSEKSTKSIKFIKY